MRVQKAGIIGQSWLLATVLFALACGRQDPGDSNEVTGKAVQAINLGPDVNPQEGDDGEDEFDGTFVERYLYRRAFPSTVLSVARRSGALAELDSMRADLGMPHVDPANDTCNGTCVAPDACLGASCTSPCAFDGESYGCDEGLIPIRSIAGCFCVPPGTPGSPVPITGCAWRPAGPTNVAGRVNSLAFDPMKANRLYAGGVGGLWRSEDKGRSWSRIVIDAATFRVSSVELNKTTPEVFVGMSDAPKGLSGDGIWRSATGDSSTWTKISSSAVDNAIIYRLRAEPGSNGRLFAATSTGVYVGTRSSAGWSWQIFAGMDSRTTDLAASFSSGGVTLYAGVIDRRLTPTHSPSGVWRFDGNSWQATDATGAAASTQWIGVTMGGIDPNAVYTLMEDLGTSPAQAKGFKTKTGGATGWSTLPTAGVVDANRAGFANFIEVDPNDPNLVFAGGELIYRSSDGGQHWTEIHLGQGSVPSPNLLDGTPAHVDMHSLAFDPSNDFGSKTTVYAATDGGVYVSDNVRGNVWRWYDRSHGMQTAELYRITAQQSLGAMVAGGLQDNSTNVTFGNRTWFTDGGCDGTEVAVDAANSLLYAQCTAHEFQLLNPVPYAPLAGGPMDSGTAEIAFPAGTREPNDGGAGVPMLMATDPSVSNVALVRALDATVKDKEALIKTADGRTWQRLPLDDLAVNERITALAITPGSGASKRYYVVTQNVANPTSSVKVYVSPNSGGDWSSASANGVHWAAGLAVDPGNANRTTPIRAWLGGVDGTISETVDGGANWTPLSNTGIPLPPGLAVTGIAFDAAGSGTLYVASDIGVFKGGLGSGGVAWETYDDGLPNGVDVNDIAFDPTSSELYIGTFGHGAYRRTVSETNCRDVRLNVRDSVFDHGAAQAVSGVPNPEWPQPIDPTSKPIFYAPDSSPGGLIYPWESTDIRVEVPGPLNPSFPDLATLICPSLLQPCSPDSVEFDSVPVQVVSPFKAPFLLHDGFPKAGNLANVYVQVTNQGVATNSKPVRVFAMYTDASVGVPPLPTNFWSQTLKPGMTGCGALDESTGWHAFGDCTVIDKVTPGMPQVAKFAWQVPSTQAHHTCSVAIIDSEDDPVDPSSSPSDVEALARTERHVAQRNLQVLSSNNALVAPLPEGAPGTPFSGIETVLVRNRWTPTGPHQVLFSTSGMESTGRLAFLLPKNQTAPNLPPSCGATANSGSTVAISVPRGLVPSELALAANGSLSLGDRASVKASGFGAGIANAGTGPTSTGFKTATGTISAISSVTLGADAVVTGDVNLGGTLNQPPTATITGHVNHTSSLAPPDIVSWNLVWPATSRGDRDVQPGQQLTEGPGRLGRVAVKTGALLKLSSGIYYVDSLTVEPGATLELNQTGGPTTIYTRQGFIFRGVDRTSAGTPPDVFLVALGSTDVVVESSFIGTIVAPTARLILGSNGGSYFGAYLARDLVVRPDVKIEHFNSAAWPQLPACRALTSSERNAINADGLAPTLYPVSTRERTQPLPIPYNQAWTIGLRYDSGTGRVGAASRFRVMSLDASSHVVAGSGYLLRQ